VDKDWVALSNGDLSGTWAFLTGRLKIRGDRGLAKKLGEIFP
jgi:putative sterol carrier protein